MPRSVPRSWDAEQDRRLRVAHEDGLDLDSEALKFATPPRSQRHGAKFALVDPPSPTTQKGQLSGLDVVPLPPLRVFLTAAR